MRLSRLAIIDCEEISFYLEESGLVKVMARRNFWNNSEICMERIPASLLNICFWSLMTFKSYLYIVSQVSLYDGSFLASILSEFPLRTCTP